MNKIKKTIWTLLLLPAFTFPLWSFSVFADRDEVFSTGEVKSGVLDIAYSSRSSGLACTGITFQRFDAFQNNPAAFSGKNELTFLWGHYLLQQDIYAENIGAGISITKQISLAGIVTYLDYGSFDDAYVDDQGNLISGGLKPRASEVLGQIGLGWQLSSQVNLGAALRVYHASWGEFSDSGFAATFGAGYHNDPFHVGLVLANLKLIGTESWPLQISLGGDYRLAMPWDHEQQWTFIGETSFLPAYQSSLITTLATEYVVHRLVAFRLGYEFSEINELDKFSGLNLGVGLHVGNYELNYAYSPMGLLGNYHRFEIGYQLSGRPEHVSDHH